MASQQTVINEFDTRSPVDWFTRMEASHALLEASTGKTISQKVFLLATMGSQGSTLLSDLLSPVSLDDSSVTYQIMRDTLVNHLRSQRLEMAERAVFYSASQNNGETAAQFFSRLKKLTEHCNFGSNLESMLRDRMVLGCISMEARRKLLQMEPLTLKAVQETLSIFEAVESARDDVLQKRSGDINQHSNEHRRLDAKKCGRCGRKACKGKDQCPAQGKICDQCGKKNHFKSVCRSKQVNLIQAQTCHRSNCIKDSTALLHVDVVPTHSVESRLLMRINSREVSMQLDTGAAASLISEKMWRSIGSPHLVESNRLFSSYDGHKMKPLGELECQLEGNGRSLKAVLTVVQSSKLYGLLGRDLIDYFVEMTGISSVHANDMESLPTMKVPPVSIFVADKSKLRFCKARPVPLPMRESVNKHLDDLERCGIITKVTGSSCASPVVWVKKRDGTLRMCADFKVYLNDSIKSDSYPLPTLETIFSGLSGAKVFARLDLRDAYSQIPLDAASRELCTLNTTKGLYQLTRLPKGMKNASAIFQRVMEETLKDLDGLIIYQDDILIHASSSDNLARRVANVLKRLEQKNVTINTEKSIMNATEIKFLGHQLSSRGIQPGTGSVAKILQCKRQSNREDLESFLGLVNYFGRMTLKFSDIVQPLHGLRKKDVPFVWNREQQQSFDALLRILSEKPVLQPYNLREEVTLTTDASERAIAGVLTQNGSPVIFVSRSLTSAERNYSNVEREALAVVWSVLRLQQLLLGRTFNLVTDHRPLLQLFGGSALPKVASARVTRWAIILQRYDYRIVYKPGSSIAHADALSRLELPSDESSIEDFVINDVDQLDVSSEILLAVEQSLPGDGVAQEIIRRVKSNNWANVTSVEKAFKRVKSLLRVKNGLLLLNNQLYLPFALRRDAFDTAHQLHTGVKSTLNRLKLSVWWPSMNKDAAKWVDRCQQCCSFRPKVSKGLSAWPKAEPFERVHADWCFVPKVGNLLLFVDSASGWIEVALPSTRSTENVIEALATLCSRHGVIKQLVTDNAAEFVSRQLNEWCNKNGIVKLESPPYHPQSNGIAERGVRTIKDCLLAWKAEVSHMSFQDYLRRVLLHHRACFRRSDGRTPGEIVYGRPLRVPLTRGIGFGIQCYFVDIMELCNLRNTYCNGVSIRRGSLTRMPSSCG